MVAIFRQLGFNRETKQLVRRCPRKLYLVEHFRAHLKRLEQLDGSGKDGGSREKEKKKRQPKPVI